LFFSIKIGGKIMDTPKQVKISEVVLWMHVFYPMNWSFGWDRINRGPVSQ
jgi:hypothetical protein